MSSISSIDLCTAHDCVTATLERTFLAQPHLPSHSVLKLRRFILDARQFVEVERAAKDALARAKVVFQQEALAESTESSCDDSFQAIDAAERENMQAAADLKCAVCHRALTRPCWYCVQCEGPFIALSLFHICHLLFQR